MIPKRIYSPRDTPTVAPTRQVRFFDAATVSDLGVCFALDAGEEVLSLKAVEHFASEPGSHKR